MISRNLIAINQQGKLVGEDLLFGEMAVGENTA